MDCTKSTNNQHYYWPKLRFDILTHIKVCTTCQKTGNNTSDMKIYPLKEAESTTWDRFLEDLIIPYKNRREGNYEPIILKALTMKDLETTCSEIIRCNNKREAIIENLL